MFKFRDAGWIASGDGAVRYCTPKLGQAISRDLSKRGQGTGWNADRQARRNNPRQDSFPFHTSPSPQTVLKLIFRQFSGGKANNGKASDGNSSDGNSSADWRIRYLPDFGPADTKPADTRIVGEFQILLLGEILQVSLPHSWSTARTWSPAPRPSFLRFPAYTLSKKMEFFTFSA